MTTRTLIRSLTVLLLGTSLLATGGAALAAPKPGAVPASPKVKAAILRDFNVSQPAQCYSPLLAKSDKRWGIFNPTLPSPAGCTPFDGAGLVHRVKGTWTSVPGASAGRDCTTVKRVLIGEHKAPLSVYRDIKAAGFCS